LEVNAKSQVTGVVKSNLVSPLYHPSKLLQSFVGSDGFVVIIVPDAIICSFAPSKVTVTASSQSIFLITQSTTLNLTSVELPLAYNSTLSIFIVIVYSLSFMYL
jgi:hypothetical protein